MAMAILVGAAGGCGPIEYINQVSVKAASALADAKRAGADRYAPYEYTAAEAYLHKAREEAGYAEYQDSIEYGRKAEEFANRAKSIAMSRLGQPTSSPAAPPSAQGDGAAAAPTAKRPGDDEDDDQAAAARPAPRKRPATERPETE